MNGLHKLLPQLTNLAKAVESALAGFLGNPKMGSWIDMIAGGIEQLAKWVGTPQFQTAMVNLGTDLGLLGAELDVLVKKFAWLLPAQPAAAQPNPSLPEFPNAPPGAPGAPGAPGEPNVPGASAPGLPSIYGKGLDWRAPWRRDYGMDFGPVAKRYGLTPAEVEAIGMQELGLQARGPDFKTGAQGMFQQEPAFQAQFGVTDPYNPNQEANALGMAMQQYLTKYKGNMAMALAAYNEGPGAVDAEIKSGGANWLQRASPAVQQYVAQIANKMGVTVKILNQTGAQTAIIANATRQ